MGSVDYRFCLTGISRIFNQLGQIVFDQAEVLSGISSISLNASELDEGVYFLQLIDENGQAYSGKFVKTE